MIYCEIDINLKRFKGDLDENITISVSNIERSSLFSVYKMVYPILRDIPELSEDHDEFMPIQTTARLTLDNSEGSLGFQRKFSDLLDNYTITEQDVTVRFFPVNDEVLAIDPVTSASDYRYWLMVGDSVDVDLEQGTVTINLKNLSIQDKEITKEINSVDFPNANTKSFGKYIPYCVGENTEVPLINIGDNQYSINTELDGNNTYSSYNTFYAKHPDGTYRRADLDSSEIYSTLTAATNVETGQLLDSVLIPFSVTPKKSFLLNRLEIQLTGNSKSAAEGDFVCEVVEVRKMKRRKDLLRVRFDVLGTANVDKANYTTEINSSSNFTVTFNFDEPVHVDMIGEKQAKSYDSISGDYLTETSQYFIISDTSPKDFATNDADVLVKFYTGSGTNFGTHAFKNLDKELWSPEVTGPVTRHRVYGVYVASNSQTSADSKGLRARYFTLAAANTGCDLNELDLIGDLNFTDTTPDDVLPRLFTTAEFDNTDVFTSWSAYSGDYSRTLSGVTTGKATRLQFAREMMRNSGSRLVALNSNNSKKTGLYAWGNNLERVALIDDRKLKSFKITYGNRATVINNVSLSYDRSSLNKPDALLLTQGLNAGYSAFLSNQSLSGSNSQTIYGVNNLANSNFPLIGDSTSASSMAEFYLRSFNDVYAQIEFAYPFLDNQNIDEILSSEVLELVTAKLPAVYGTSSNPLPITYGGDTVVETNGVDNLRANTYRVQVKSKKIKRIDGVFFLHFVGKLLNNEFDPS